MNILVAEDDGAILEVVKIILEGEGYTVFHAPDEKTVLSLAQKETPRLILLDISLGNSNGGVITQKLKKSAVTKDIPVIIMSANTETEEIAKSSGAQGFLLKPFDLNDLIATVKSYTA